MVSTSPESRFPCTPDRWLNGSRNTQNKATTICGQPAESLRQVPVRHNRRGDNAEIKVRFAPPTMCRLTLYIASSEIIEAWNFISCPVSSFCKQWKWGMAKLVCSYWSDKFSNFLFPLLFALIWGYYQICFQSDYLFPTNCFLQT